MDIEQLLFGFILRVFLHVTLCHVYVSFGETAGLPDSSVVKNLPASAEDAGSIPGLGRSPGEGNGNPLQCSCLGNPMDRGAWWATVRGVAKEPNLS